MNLADLLPPDDLPAKGARVPGVVVRVAPALLGILLTLVVFGLKGWFVVGLIFSLLAAWAPEYLLGWLLIVFLAIGELGHSPGVSWRLLVLLAGVHLLHVLGSLALALPWRGWLQPRLFLRPLIRFVAIQVPTQIVAVVLLELLAPNAHGHRPLRVVEFTVLGGAALAALALLLLRRERDASI